MCSRMNLTEDDQQLDHNLMELNHKLCFLMESADIEKGVALKENVSSSSQVLMELQSNFNDLKLDENAPNFQFHGYGCLQAVPKRTLNARQVAESGTQRKKSRSNGYGGGGGGQLSLVSRQKQQQLEKENMWNIGQGDMNQVPITIERLRSIGLNSNGVEPNVVLRLMELLSSLHEHMNAELCCSQQYALPSDYLFDMPKKRTMPKSLSLRHQVQVLCTKLERFLTRQRRVLESNRHFDYDKYTECDELLKRAASYVQPFRQFTTIEVRHRNGTFVSDSAKKNALKLEQLLVSARDWLKAAHLCVFVFNWEMDHEHRYSSAMTQRHEQTIQKALLLAAAELQAAQPRPPSREELLIAERYQLDNVIKCAAEHDEFLSALLHMPEAYFPPEIVAMCSPKADSSPVEPQTEIYTSDDWMVLGDVIEEAPSSPLRRNTRNHKPLIYKG